MHYCTYSRISLCLIAITSSNVLRRNFLAIAIAAPAACGVGIDRERDSGTTWKGRRSGKRRSARRRGTRERGCPNGIRIGMGREPCTEQPRRHPAFARIATLTPWLAHGKRRVSRERKQILRNRAAHCLEIHRRGVDFGGSTSTSLSRCSVPTYANISYLSGHARPYHEACRSHFERTHCNHSGLTLISSRLFRH